MTWATKLWIMATVTLMISSVPVGQIILCCVWVFHLIFFLFGIKTLSPAQKAHHRRLDQAAENA